jgi:hypothetical protein
MASATVSKPTLTISGARVALVAAENQARKMGVPMLVDLFVKQATVISDDELVKPEFLIRYVLTYAAGISPLWMLIHTSSPSAVWMEPK